MFRDPLNEYIIAPTRTPFAVTTDADLVGSAVDLSNGQILSIAILSVGAVSGTGSPTAAVKLQSNTTSATTGFTDIAGAAFAGATTTGNHQVISFQTPAGRNWVRCTGTVAGTTPSFTATVEILSMKKYNAASGLEAGVSRSPSS